MLLRFSDTAYLAAFQESLQREYPRITREQQVGVQISSAAVSPMPTETLMRFSDREGRWDVVLGESALTLECRAYEHIHDFSRRFEKVLTAAGRDLRIKDRTRLGLRYVNEFRVPEAKTLADWKKYIRPALLGFAVEGDHEGRVDQMMQQVVFRREAGSFAVRHGLLRGSAVQPRPSDPKLETEGFYLLDLDFFDEAEAALDVQATVNQARKFNDEIYAFFIWSTTTQAASAPVPEFVGTSWAAEPQAHYSVLPAKSPAQRLYELSGLDVKRLALLFGVTRQAFYGWIQGARARGGSYDRLLQIVPLVEEAAKRLGSPQAVRDWLLSPVVANGPRPFDLLRGGNNDAFRGFLTQGRTVPFSDSLKPFEGGGSDSTKRRLRRAPRLEEGDE